MARSEFAQKLITNRFLNLLTIAIIALAALAFLDLSNPNNFPSKILTSKTSPIDQETLVKIRQTSRQIYDSCRNQQANCYEEKVTSRLLAIYKTKEILEALYDYDRHFSCHAFTHFVGRALYRRAASVADSYSQIDFTCHGGTYHGVMEAFLDENRKELPTMTGNQFRTICKDSKVKTDKNPNQVYTECLHGLGHAFMFLTDSDLPISLAYCDRLGPPEEREPCYGGTFMENSTSSTNPDHPPRWIKTDDKFYPCTILPDKYLNQCYFYQANFLIKESVHNYQQVFEDCYELSISHFDHCILGLGANLAGFSRKAGIAGAAQVCSLGKDSTQSLCVLGAVPSLAARYGGETAKIVEFCNKVAENLKEVCFKKFNQVMTDWGYRRGDFEIICQKAGNFVDACLGYSKVELVY